MERKGQSLIEYLLITGTTILFVVIVILAITGTLESSNRMADYTKFCAEHNMQYYDNYYKCRGLSQNDELLSCSFYADGNLIYFTETCNWKEAKPLVVN